MWTFIHQTISSTTSQFHIITEQKRMSFLEVFEAWQNSPAFNVFYTQLLVDFAQAGIFWEHPPLTKNDLDQPYEVVLIKSEILGKLIASPQTFASHFHGGKAAVSFLNLGKDARLIVPVPLDNTSDYAHLHRFLRKAPPSQINEFWQTVGTSILSHLSENKTWISVAGLGVYWLHIRLDSRPKYYKHKIYKNS